MAAQQRITINPRLLLSLMVLFVVIFSALYFVLDSEAKANQAQLEILKAEKEAYGAELRRLKSEIDYVEEGEGLEKYARAKGMIMPGEVQYVAGESSDLQ